MTTSKQLDTLLDPFLEKFTSQLDASAFVLATPSFIINKGTYLHAAKDYISDRLMAKLPHLEEAFEALDNKKMPTREQLGSMIVAKRALAGEGVSSELGFLAFAQLASAVKQHAVVTTFDQVLVEQTLATPVAQNSQQVKENSHVQKLAATFLLLEKLHPQSASMIRHTLKNPPMNNPKITDAVEDLARNPTVEVLKHINKAHPQFLQEYYPQFAQKMEQNDNTNLQFGLSNRERTADLESWRFAPSPNQMKNKM